MWHDTEESLERDRQELKRMEDELEELEQDPREYDSDCIADREDEINDPKSHKLLWDTYSDRKLRSSLPDTLLQEFDEKYHRCESIVRTMRYWERETFEREQKSEELSREIWKFERYIQGREWQMEAKKRKEMAQKGGGFERKTEVGEAAEDAVNFERRQRTRS
jgi:hypothetical protein